MPGYWETAGNELNPIELGRLNQEGMEARLAEMDISRQRIMETHGANYEKAKAIGERPGLIVMLQKEPTCLGEAIGVHPLHMARLGGKNGLEKGIGEMADAASLQQGRRFIKDIIGRYESPLRLSSLLYEIASPRVHTLGLDQKGIKPTRIDERFSGRRRSGRFLHWLKAAPY
jgi:hypothetical protein